MESVEAVVIGAGVVGLAVARALALEGREVVVLESERGIGTGTSSRNSEVIHSGIYYPTGSLKAKHCVAGRGALYAYCAAKGVPHKRLGKIIVATSPEEIPVLAKYRTQALANGVCDLIDLPAAEVRAMEPAVQCAAGLYSPSTGIIDSHALMLALQGDLEARGGTVALGAPVVGGSVGQRETVLHVGGPAPCTLRTELAVNCAGLGAQALSQSLEGVERSAIPPRHLAQGHYFSLSARAPFQHLVYPLANSAGLGVHVTLDLHGAARFGPDVRWVERVDYRFDAPDERRRQFAAAIRLYYPQLDDTKLLEGYTGIRPKISGPGEPAADFCVRGPAAHGNRPYAALYGIESPGLTSCLALAGQVVSLFQ
jgi:L-2-hydroxyglutarate oxidase LhgO